LADEATLTLRLEADLPPVPPDAPIRAPRYPDPIQAPPQQTQQGFTANAPPWMAFNADKGLNLFRSHGLENEIGKLSALRKTAEEVASEINKLNPAIKASVDDIRLARLAIGIPSMTIGAGGTQSANPDFEVWRKKFLDSQSNPDDSLPSPIIPQTKDQPKREIRGEEVAKKFIDPDGMLDLSRAGDYLLEIAKSAIEAGDRVELILEGKAREIVSVTGRLLRDAGGREWKPEVVLPRDERLDSPLGKRQGEREESSIVITPKPQPQSIRDNPLLDEMFGGPRVPDSVDTSREDFALKAAREAMQRERERMDIHAARMTIDPTYRDRVDAEDVERKRRQDETDRRDRERLQRESDQKRIEAERADPLFQAKEAMEREDRIRKAHAARMTIDPIYKADYEQEEAAKRTREEERDRRERERAFRAERELYGKQPEMPFDPMQAAIDAKEKQDRAKNIENARRSIDPEFDRRRQEEEDKEREKEEYEAGRSRREKMHYGGQAMGQLGIPGAGIVSAAATGNLPAVGMAVLATAINAVEKAVNAVMQTGKQGAMGVMSFDPMQINRGFADLASNVPIVGGLFGGLINTTLDLSDAMMNTARRLSAYNGELAAGMARIDVERLMRDIERARTHGPELLAAAERRATFEEKWSELIDKMMPTVLAFLEEMMSFLEENAPMIANVMMAILRILAAIANMIFLPLRLVPGISALFADVAAIRDSVRPTTESPFFSEIIGMFAPSTVTPRPGGLPRPGVPFTPP